MKRFTALMLTMVMAISCLSGIVHATGIGSFTDVPTNAWYYSNVNYAAEHGLVSGTSATTFSPNANITRAQFITILYRAFGDNEDVAPDKAFIDVPTVCYYRDAVYWGQKHGIVYGTSQVKFSPDRNITRQEAVVMMGRAIASLSIDVADAENPVPKFRDASQTASWARNDVDLMRRKGLISGYSDGSFGPNRLMARAEGTTMLVRLVKAEIKSPEELNNTAHELYEGFLARFKDKVRMDLRDKAEEILPFWTSICPGTEQRFGYSWYVDYLINGQVYCAETNEYITPSYSYFGYHLEMPVRLYMTSYSDGEELRYAYYDANGDGVDELFVAKFSNNELQRDIIAVYAIVEDTLVRGGVDVEYGQDHIDWKLTTTQEQGSCPGMTFVYVKLGAAAFSTPIEIQEPNLQWEILYQKN